MKQNRDFGFSLIELLVSVAIVGILSAVAIPMYRDYIDNSRITVVKNNLRAIYLQQQEYFNDNNVYYATDAASATCTDKASVINTNLFNGSSILDNEYFYYCILQTTTSDFTATATEISGSRTFTIDEDNDVNW